MAATFTLTDVQKFPNGTSVGAYPVANWPAHTNIFEGAPLGSATNSQTMTSGTLTFTGLTSGVDYQAVAQVGGVYRYSRFTAGADSTIAGSGATDQDITDAVAAEATARAAADAVITANTQTADYTLVLGDAGKCVELNSASAHVVTVPTNASVAFPTGTVIELHRYGAGTFTVAAAGGVTINSPGAVLTLRAQFSGASLRKRGTNEWELTGDLG